MKCEANCVPTEAAGGGIRQPLQYCAAISAEPDKMVVMKCPRFTLRSVFVALTLAAMFLGYSQWRRHRILSEAAELKSQGFTLLWEDGWVHQLWPVVPADAKCEYYTNPDGTWRFGSNVYQAFDDDAINAHYARGTDRLSALGVTSVRLDKEGVRGDTYTSTRRGK